MVSTFLRVTGRAVTLRCVLSASCLLWPALCCTAAGQSLPPSGAPQSSLNSSFTFRADVNQVLIRAVVRDGQGRAAPGLQADDFRIIDNGKLQHLSSFNEVSGGRSSLPPENTAANPARSEETSPAPSAATVATPTQIASYAVYLLDDMHMNMEELHRARGALARQLEHLDLHPGQMFAVISSSGRAGEAFTRDAAAIRSTLSKLTAQDRRLEQESACPYMNYSLARRLETDTVAKGEVITDTMQCLQTGTLTSRATCSGVPHGLIGGGDEEPAGCTLARQAVEAAMRQQIVSGTLDGWKLITALEGAIRQLTAVQGERRIVLFSPGFTIEPRLLEKYLDRALRAGIAIDVIDTRGLAPEAMYDAGQGRFSQRATTYIRDSEKSRLDALTQITDGTGGKLYKNRNDLDYALEQATGVPETYYLLTYSPGVLKNNGNFHQLKVKLAHGSGMQVTARRGYYEPSRQEATSQAAQQALAELFFSPEEKREIPLSINVYFGRTGSDGKFELAHKNDKGMFEAIARANIGIQSLPFRRSRGLATDELTEICGVFDEQGTFLTAKQNTTRFHLTKEQLAKLPASIDVSSKFALKPGLYVFRFVIQDREGHQVVARSVAVPIR